MAKFGKALDKGLDILEALQQASSPLSFTELRDRIEVSPASFSRFLKLLLERDYVTRDGQGLYSIGMRAIQVGLSALAGLPLTEIILPHLREITASTEESSEIAVFDGESFSFLHREECRRSVILRGRPGFRFTIRDTTAIGRLALAYGIGTDPDQPDPGVLSEVKRERFAEMLQNEDEVYRCAVPVFDHSATCFACLTIAAPAFRVSSKEKNMFRDILTGHAVQVSERLGFRA
jgi:DNA-binding IclR family transcriptional regulator